MSDSDDDDHSYSSAIGTDVMAGTASSGVPLSTITGGGGTTNAAASYPLHRCVFAGDIRRLSLLLRTHDVAAKDKHGELASCMAHQENWPYGIGRLMDDN